jgi:hypothetical protein
VDERTTGGKPYEKFYGCGFFSAYEEPVKQRGLAWLLVKETLGIGVHVKPRYPGLTTGPPGTNGRGENQMVVR